MQHLVFACARLVHLEFASAPDLYLGFPDMLRDALGVARSATLTHSELLRDEKNALGCMCVRVYVCTCACRACVIM